MSTGISGSAGGRAAPKPRLRGSRVIRGQWHQGWGGEGVAGQQGPAAPEGGSPVKVRPLTSPPGCCCLLHSSPSSHIKPSSRCISKSSPASVRGSWCLPFVAPGGSKLQVVTTVPAWLSHLIPIGRLEVDLLLSPPSEWHGAGHQCHCLRAPVSSSDLRGLPAGNETHGGKRF